LFQVHTAAAERLAAVLRDCTSMPASAFPPPFAGGSAAAAAAAAAGADAGAVTALAGAAAPSAENGGRAPVLLDVCCGAGTLGLVLARHCGCPRVLGVESCAPAVEDARRNAQANGLDDVATFGKETPLLRRLCIKCIILPRQARDKHRESTQKRVAFP
jgi:hypothetical protein